MSSTRGGESFWLDKVIPFKEFSVEFAQFTKSCLQKDPNTRMNPSELLTTKFITLHNGSDDRGFGCESHRRIISEFINP